jgi:hypothetical protein
MFLLNTKPCLRKLHKREHFSQTIDSINCLQYLNLNCHDSEQNGQRGKAINQIPLNENIPYTTRKEKVQDQLSTMQKNIPKIEPAPLI